MKHPTITRWLAAAGTLALSPSAGGRTALSGYRSGPSQRAVPPPSLEARLLDNGSQRKGSGNAIPPRA